MNDTHQFFMGKALEEAAEAARCGEVPVGAVIVCGGKIIGRGHNMTESLTDVTAHAEMQAITAAANYLGGKYLTDCTLYVTVEPCLMCAGALAWSQIGSIVYGASDTKRGFASYYFKAPDAINPLHPKTTVISGIREEECRQLMQDFFRARR